MGKLLLAPMEGSGRRRLRDVLTRVGAYDLAVSEFIRVSGNLLPPRPSDGSAPSSITGSRTRAGTPLVVQLLGSDPACLADNAAQLVELAPAGIDLNFGCPAPTVNRHGGGATLLADPEQLLRIVAAVRRVVPAPKSRLPPRCGSVYAIRRKRSIARGRWPPAVSWRWSCMPAPAPTAIDRRHTGNG
jgi:tRNA-dihydrouridine synthase C